MAKMHTSLLLSIALTIAWILPVCAQGLDERGQQILDRVYAEHTLAGLSAAVSRGGKMVFSGGVGFADIENRVPAQASMVHRIASISKPQTAIAVMQLVEQGKVGLDAPIRTYIPRFPEKSWPILVKHLLSHTGGIRHYKPGEAGTMENFGFMKKALRVFEDDPLLFEPGTQYSYSTYGYTPLGVIVEEVSGQKFGEYLHDHIWEPAGMTSSRLEVQGEIVAKRARGYSYDPQGELRNARYTDLSVKYAGGGMLSTVEDLVKLGNAFWSGELVSKETRDRMLQPVSLPDGSSTHYGLGWGVGTREELGRYYSHGGGQTGTSTFLVHFYDAGVVVAVFSNVDGTGSATQEVAIELARAVAADSDS